MCECCSVEHDRSMQLGRQPQDRLKSRHGCPLLLMLWSFSNLATLNAKGFTWNSGGTIPAGDFVNTVGGSHNDVPVRHSAGWEGRSKVR